LGDVSRQNYLFKGIAKLIVAACFACSRTIHLSLTLESVTRLTLRFAWASRDNRRFLAARVRSRQDREWPETALVNHDNFYETLFVANSLQKNLSLGIVILRWMKGA
jgi:hypothetical protein